MEKILFYIIYWVITSLIVFIVKKLFDRTYERKKSTSIKFLKSLSEVVIITIATFFFLAQFDATKDISKTILKSSSLIIPKVAFSIIYSTSRSVRASCLTRTEAAGSFAHNAVTPRFKSYSLIFHVRFFLKE